VTNAARNHSRELGRQRSNRGRDFGSNTTLRRGTRHFGLLCRSRHGGRNASISRRRIPGGGVKALSLLLLASALGKPLRDPLFDARTLEIGGHEIGIASRSIGDTALDIALRGNICRTPLQLDLALLDRARFGCTHFGDATSFGRRTVLFDPRHVLALRGDAGHTLQLGDPYALLGVLLGNLCGLLRALARSTRHR
jgi:hypothetical protein